MNDVLCRGSWNKGYTDIMYMSIDYWVSRLPNNLPSYTARGKLHLSIMINISFQLRSWPSVAVLFIIFFWLIDVDLLICSTKHAFLYKEFRSELNSSSDSFLQKVKLVNTIKILLHHKLIFLKKTNKDDTQS